MLLQTALFHPFLWLSNVPLRILSHIFFIQSSVNGHLSCFLMFNIANYERNANKNHNEVLLHSGQNGHHQSLQIINAGEDVEKKEPSYTIGGNVNWHNHKQWQRVWRFLEKLKIELPCDPAIPYNQRKL